MTSFGDDPSVDFGGLVRREPAVVHAPATTDELVACMRALAAAGTPYKLRGAAHSASGEVLSDGGAVIDLRRLAGVVADDPAREQVTALAGTTWLALWEHLAAQGRRPLTLTDNPRVTLGGTLACGGVGDASHLVGPQVAGVVRAVLVTPDGARHALARGEPLLDHALCSHGQLGVLAEVTLATRRASSTVHGRLVQWGSLAAHLDDVAALRHDYVRGRVVWTEGLVRAVAFVACSEPAAELPVPRDAIATSETVAIDMLDRMRGDPSALYPAFNPCIEVALPYPAALPALQQLDTLLARSALLRWLPRGSSLALVAGTRGLPLSPFASERNVLLAVRPEAPTLADAQACEPVLRAIADLALAAGGRVYLASFQLAADALARQLGAAGPALAQLRRAVDPGGLCNRGSLHGWQP
ncbi:MAG: FAD-binding oxidoreductase [Acidobacteriota bacterium]